MRFTEMEIVTASNKFRGQEGLRFSALGHPKCGPPGTGVEDTRELRAKVCVDPCGWHPRTGGVGG